MFRKRYPKGQNPYVLILGVIVILSILFTIVSQKNQDKLAVYNDSDKVETKDITEEDEDELDIDTEIYTDNEHHFSLSVPSDWQQVTQDGYTTFIHRASASALQIQVLDYDPQINNDSQDSLASQVNEDGKTFISFTKNTTSSYELMYQDYQNNTYDYIEEVYWDRDNIIKLNCTFNDANYEKIISYYELIINSFAWKKTSEIPEDYTMYYNEDAKFEVMVPASWALGVAENTIVATDGTTGATETIVASSSTSTFRDISATNMSKFLNTGQTGFMMNSYDNSGEPAIAKCSYILNNVKYQEVVYGYSTGQSLYFVMFEYESGTIEEDLISVCGSSLRSFASTEKEETNTSDTTENTEESTDTNESTKQETTGTENSTSDDITTNP